MPTLPKGVILNAGIWGESEFDVKNLSAFAVYWGAYFTKIYIYQEAENSIVLDKANLNVMAV